MPERAEEARDSSPDTPIGDNRDDPGCCSTTLHYGELPPLKMDVWIEAKVVKRRWWFGNRTDFYVCTDYMRWGPLSRAEATEQATTLRLSVGATARVSMHSMPVAGRVPR